MEVTQKSKKPLLGGGGRGKRGGEWGGEVLVMLAITFWSTFLANRQFIWGLSPLPLNLCKVAHHPDLPGTICF